MFFRCGADTVGILCNFWAYASSDGVHLGKTIMTKQLRSMPYMGKTIMGKVLRSMPYMARGRLGVVGLNPTKFD